MASFFRVVDIVNTNMSFTDEKGRPLTIAQAMEAVRKERQVFYDGHDVDEVISLVAEEISSRYYGLEPEVDVHYEKGRFTAVFTAFASTVWQTKADILAWFKLLKVSVDPSFSFETMVDIANREQLEELTIVVNFSVRKDGVPKSLKKWVYLQRDVPGGEKLTGIWSAIKYIFKNTSQEDMAVRDPQLRRLAVKIPS
jgi:hypothetical protein